MGEAVCESLSGSSIRRPRLLSYQGVRGCCAPPPPGRGGAAGFLNSRQQQLGLPGLCPSPAPFSAASFHFLLPR